ncbi:hypothetical protein BDP81DRAFT_156155 [Colletotrichum phormii]|uniref:Uncharacterized protein n=1 Tax=Colletotrichum phormii TaxID=359342 RepID=A0AAI9ZEN5_9PEZI|nr:uncharacterized protein BDP81DRAFT_156155 [Colletotrichum phormii]KAK1622086.1 hypothetical protein BDP81DRAFT_156155 [Colletotrichum phormii]
MQTNTQLAKHVTSAFLRLSLDCSGCGPPRSRRSFYLFVSCPSRLLYSWNASSNHRIRAFGSLTCRPTPSPLFEPNSPAHPVTDSSLHSPSNRPRERGAWGETETERQSRPLARCPAAHLPPALRTTDLPLSRLMQVSFEHLSGWTGSSIALPRLLFPLLTSSRRRTVLYLTVRRRWWPRKDA